ncbi:MAG: Gfo/Idh/MocA family oxidoreductase [Syntrophaceae bacterium]|nr:Gfo/Idh/MocA family oxidoreductase [Syntrophaceae bacterium]
MKVSIIGAGRKRSGIGEYIARYFHKNGADVVSVLGTTEQTSRNAASALAKYGIRARAYTDFDQMVGNEQPDSMVIASPSRTHFEYLMRCIDSGLNIFCEKPFIWSDERDMARMVETIFEKAGQKSLTVAMNSQWPFSIRYYEELCGKISVRKRNKFFISLSPFCSGKEMILESVPHALSLLYFVFGSGGISQLDFESAKENQILLRFEYLFDKGGCDVLIRLMRQEAQPRDFSFGFNDRIVSRRIDLPNYDIYFNYEDRRTKIADPLESSVRDFVEAVRQKTPPLIGYAHISNNMSLLKRIYDGFSEVEERIKWKS